MAVTNIPNVQNWTVTPQNGQPGYFTLMNTWLGQSTLVIASLQTAITAQNTANSEINALAIQAENNAIIANGLANFQGAWSGLVPYLKGQSVSSSGLYYTSKVDSNLNHAVTDTAFWLPNPINDKLDKDFYILTDKITPSDSDILAIRESGGLLKKLSWSNIKATLKTYFDTFYMALTGNQTIDGIKTFNLSPIVPTPTTGTQAVNKAYADLKVALASFTGSNQSLTGSGYQKLPGGLIIQWGTSVAVTNAGGGESVTYPIAFPTSSFQPIICNGDNNVSLHNVSIISVQVSRTGFGWASSLANTAQRINWIAIGF